MIDKIKQKATDMLEMYKKNKDEKMIKHFTIINKILSNEDAFNKLDAEIIINILNDIIGDKNKAVDVYKQIQYSNLKK